MSILSSEFLTTWPVLFLIIAVTLGPGLVIGRLTAGAIGSWYQGLKKPSWNPPNWLFGPVWTVLYLAMSVALWMVWLADPSDRTPIVIYAVQLVLNHAWSPLFFLARKPGLAFKTLCALWVAVAAMAVQFYTVEPLAAKLLLPYLAWLGYAGALNYRIWQDNRKPASAGNV